MLNINLVNETDHHVSAITDYLLVLLLAWYNSNNLFPYVIIRISELHMWIAMLNLFFLFFLKPRQRHNYFRTNSAR